MDHVEDVKDFMERQWDVERNEWHDEGDCWELFLRRPMASVSDVDEDLAPICPTNKFFLKQLTWQIIQVRIEK